MGGLSSKLAGNRTKESHLQDTGVIKLMLRDLAVGHIVHRLTLILQPGSILVFTKASNNPVVSTFNRRGLE